LSITPNLNFKRKVNMIREYRRKKSYYTTFKQLKNGDRFRTNPAQNGPFVKSGPRVYEDARRGDDTTQTWINQPVRKLWPIGIQPN
jgi:hypothetical protein